MKWILRILSFVIILVILAVVIGYSIPAHHQLTRKIELKQTPDAVFAALFVPVDIGDTLLKGIPHFLAQGPQYIASCVVLFSTGVTGAITRNEKYHKIFAVSCLCHIVWISFAIFYSLQ